MIRFDGQLVPRRTFIRNNYWHDSVLNRIYNSIRNYETSNDAAAACLQDFNVDIYKLNNVAALIGAGKESVVKARVEMMNFTKSVINAMILDTKDEEYENKGRSIEGVAELLVHQGNRLVAETDIPHTKLLGESPDGSNATGNSTSQMWNDFIASEQENYAKAKLQQLIAIVFPEIKRLGFKFRPLRTMDEKETADVRKANADTDAVYINSGVLDPSEVTESRFGGEEYGNEIKIDKEARESGLISAGSNEDLGADDEENEGGDDDNSGGVPTRGGQEGNPKESKPMSTTGDKPPEGRKQEQGPSANGERKNKQKPGSKNQDLTGREKSGLDSIDPLSPIREGDEVSVTSKEAGMGQSEFEPRNEEIKVPGGKPATMPFISQTMSDPFRDPLTDPAIKGPGIPNKARSFLPTRGNGVTAQSGFDFQKDAGKSGSNIEITQMEPKKTEDSEVGGSEFKEGAPGAFGFKEEKDTETAMGRKLARLRDRHRKDPIENDEPKRAATIIVRRGDDFLMGKRRDNGRWTLPGGHVDKDESHHQGAIRELAEETGFIAKKLKFIGGRVVEPKLGKSVHLNIYEHTPDTKAKPTWKLDPDKEINEFKWVSAKKPLDEDMLGNLQHPNNVALQHLGLLK